MEEFAKTTEFLTENFKKLLEGAEVAVLMFADRIAIQSAIQQEPHPTEREHREKVASAARIIREHKGFKKFPEPKKQLSGQQRKDALDCLILATCSDLYFEMMKRMGVSK